jgi:hypothetical protein
MALLLTGKSICEICHRVIEESDEVIGFAHFVLNRDDPLYFFSDAGFHETCVVQHPMGDKAIQRFEEWVLRAGPSNRICLICHQRVLDPDDYILIAHLTADKNHAAFQYNYTHLHKRCLPQWPDRERVIAILEDLRQSGNWDGDYLGMLIQDLRLGRGKSVMNV